MGLASESTGWNGEQRSEFSIVTISLTPCTAS